ncbi:MAG: MerR family transcriptional regulator [Oscillospiraceae bacterium]|jgi:DNA-binding transcriptional MerR regulator|nr:MerR family transcriptional regulator [Oscillospiraceae bacterium]
MDGYMTISQVSRQYQISARMLRHYEKLGMIASTRRENYAYRVFDQEAVKRVRQIVILRRFRLPLKKIREMMEGTREDAIRILEERLRDVDEGAETVRTMREALFRLLELLRTEEGDPMEALDDPEAERLVRLLPMEKHQLKEEKAMSVTKEMIEKDGCVRVLMLPPATMAAYQYIGERPEEHMEEVMTPFIQNSGLYLKKPDARYFGFNHPDPEEGNPVYGYEVWVTIPDDMEVPAPLVKKRFPGGLYAAYTISFPDFFEWPFLYQWAERNEQYEPAMAPREERNMGGALEEHLNWVYSAHMGWPENGIDGKLDLLLPIRRREK